VLDGVRDLLANGLQAEGFERSKDLSLVRRRPESVLRLWLHPDKYNTKTEGRFTVEMFMWYPALAKAADEFTEKEMREGGLHLQERLGNLRQQTSGKYVDKWWDVAENSDPRPIADELFALWWDYGRDWATRHETLAGALPALGEGVKYEVAAHLALGDAGSARRSAIGLWKPQMASPEHVEWLWNRGLIDVNAPRDGLSDDDGRVRGNVLWAIWIVASLDPNMVELAKSASSELASVPGAESRACELARSIISVGGKTVVVPPDVPSQMKLAKIPKLARVAFAVRCAQRVHGLVGQCYPRARQSQLDAIAAAIEAAERVAAGEMAPKEAERAAKKVESVAHSISRASEQHPEYDPAYWAADAAAWAAFAATLGPTSVELCARSSVNAVKEESNALLRLAIWDDFHRFRSAAVQNNWTDKTPMTTGFTNQSD
jgi:hypothetical protein